MSEAWHRFADFVDRVDELPGLAARAPRLRDRPGRRGRRRLRRPVPERGEQGGRAGVPGDPPAVARRPRARAPGHDVLRALRADQRPMLMLWGAEDRPLPLATGEAFAASIGRSIATSIEGAGPLPPGGPGRRDRRDHRGLVDQRALSGVRDRKRPHQDALASHPHPRASIDRAHLIDKGRARTECSHKPITATACPARKSVRQTRVEARANRPATHGRREPNRPTRPRPRPSLSARSSDTI